MLTFTGGGEAVIDIVDLGIVAGTNYTLIGLSTSSGLTTSNLTLGNTPNGFAGTFQLNANSIVLHVDAVPEPSSFALAVVGLTGVFVVARRRRQILRES